MDNVACTGSESGLINCNFDNHTGDCSHSEDAGVRCYFPPSTGENLHPILALVVVQIVISVVFCTSCFVVYVSLYSAWPYQRFLVCLIMLVLSISCGMNRY